MPAKQDKSLARSLGEFFGHIVKGIKSDPAAKRTVVKKTTEERREGDVVLRRTVIDEVEIRPPGPTEP